MPFALILVIAAVVVSALILGNFGPRSLRELPYFGPVVYAILAVSVATVFVLNVADNGGSPSAVADAIPSPTRDACDTFGFCDDSDCPDGQHYDDADFSCAPGTPAPGPEPCPDDPYGFDAPCRP